jgi:DNA-binding PadR family transcriptional regulator
MMAIPTPDETILGLLLAQKRHGYQLVEIFNDPQQLGKIWHLSTSQLYAVLKRLEHKDLIRGQSLHSENAPTRIEYQITAAGIEVFEAWLNEEKPRASIRSVRVEFLSRFYLAHLLNRSTMQILKYQRKSCQAELERLLSEREGMEDSISSLTSEFFIAQLQAVTHWLATCESIVSAKRD